MLAPLPWNQFLTVMTLNWPQLYWKINFLPRSKILLRIRYKMFHNSLLWNMCICQKLDFFSGSLIWFFFPLAFSSCPSSLPARVATWARSKTGRLFGRLFPFLFLTPFTLASFCSSCPFCQSYVQSLEKEPCLGLGANGHFPPILPQNLIFLL